jgi:hypothetical protein
MILACEARPGQFFLGSQSKWGGGGAEAEYGYGRDGAVRCSLPRVHARGPRLPPPPAHRKFPKTPGLAHLTSFGCFFTLFAHMN